MMAAQGPPAESNGAPAKKVKAHFVFTGFTHDLGFRVFAYERIGAEQVRTKFTVRAELALIRRFAIRLQELPLMCLGILEQLTEDADACGSPRCESVSS